MMDENIDGTTLHAGGTITHSADGDMNGDMIVSYTGYAVSLSLSPCFSPSLSLSLRPSPHPRPQLPPSPGLQRDGIPV